MSPPPPQSAQGRPPGCLLDACRRPAHDAQRLAVPAAARRLAVAARAAAGRAGWDAVWCRAAVDVLRVHLPARPGGAHAGPLPPDHP